MRTWELIETSAQEQRKRSEHQVAPADVAGVLALQWSIGNRATSSVLQRKLDPSLTGRDANRRLQEVLKTAPKGKFGASAAPDTSRYDAIVRSNEVYDWERIQSEFGPFEQNLRGYAQGGTRRITLYRADSRTPAKLKGSNPPGFGVRQSVPFSLVKAHLLKDPIAFAEDHVRGNRQDLKSYATTEDAGGYASNDRPLYKVDLGDWTVFERPQKARELVSAKILANSGDLNTATRIAIDTLKDTKEIFLLFELGLRDITSVRLPGENTFSPIAWDTIVAERLSG